MPRRARFAPPGLFLHITQRGNYRQRTFFSDADRQYYLSLIEQHASERSITIAGYCLMSNHIHLLASGAHEGAISAFMKGVNGEYAHNLHGRLGRRGRLWQGRFFSCVLDEWHMTSVLRYIERNPVRAEMVATAGEYPWSSARAHLGLTAYPEWLDEACFAQRWTTVQWSTLLADRQAKGEVSAIRLATRQERPLGSEKFVRELERRWSIGLPRASASIPAKPPGKQTYAAPTASQRARM